MGKYTLLQFFLEVVQAAVDMPPNRYGSPVSHLLECLVLYQEVTLEKILKERDHSFEFRINGAGLKMYFSHRGPKGRITIGGDQADLYPEFVEKVNGLIRKHQFTGITWKGVANV